MKKILFSCAILIAINFAVKAQTKEQLFEKVWKGVGGKPTFEKSRYLQFTFAVEHDGQTGNSRDHLWDRYTGDYRFENKTADGKKMVVLFNVNTQKGKAYEENRALPDSISTRLIKKAYAAFINDSYWLMVPLKLQDPGVNTDLEGSEMVNGAKCQILHLNFDKVGLTPGDQYWLFVNDETGEINQWKFLLQGQKNSSIFEWQPYVDLGDGLKLSTKKTNMENKTSIVFPVAKVLQRVDKDIFIKP